MAVAPSRFDEAPLLAEGMFERHAAALRAFCVHRTSSRADAEEAVQATFLRALRAMRAGVRPHSERAWLLTIARNVCATQATSAHRRREVALDPAHLEVGAEDTRLDDVDPELIAALEALPDGQRRAFVLRAVDGLSYREIAAELGVTEAAVETWIFRARRKLAAAVGESRRRLGSVSSLFGALKSAIGGGAVLKAAAAAAVVVAAGASVAPVVRDREPAPARPAQPIPSAPATKPRAVSVPTAHDRASDRPQAPSAVEQGTSPKPRVDIASDAAPPSMTSPKSPAPASSPESSARTPKVPPSPVEGVTDTVDEIVEPVRETVNEVEVPPVAPLPELPVPDLPAPSGLLPVDVPDVEVPPLLP